MRSALVLALALPFVALFAASTACDPLPDECDEGAARCDSNNVAVNCVRPGPEAHASEEFHSCGAGARCFISTGVGQTATGAQCARNDADAGACPGPGVSACNGSSQAVCNGSADGGSFWVDYDCKNAGGTGQCTTDNRGPDGGTEAYCL